MSKSDESTIESFLDELNGYLGRPRQHYDHVTKKHFVGAFYLDKSIDRKGRKAYRISEVITEDGAFRGYAQYGLKTEEVRIWIDGLIQGIHIQKGLAK